jgi:ADP-ribosylglycohydrolase
MNLERMQRSLEALALGDAFGQQFFAGPEVIQPMLDLRQPPKGLWPWTDDTAMALAIVEVLTRQGCIDQDELALAFCRNYLIDPGRGYGAGMHKLMDQLDAGADWRAAGASLFGGGSFGNGGAMRVAPLGAYFADDLVRVVEQATLATMVTHAHAGGIAGGVAVALAAALSAQGKLTGRAFIEAVADRTQHGEVRDGLVLAATLADTASAGWAAAQLGNGGKITAPDTVPFCVWAAAKFLPSLEEALWQVVAVGGDRDTNCAIVAGIIGAHPHSTLPAWRSHREPLP